jgi:hypothetical protein
VGRCVDAGVNGSAKTATWAALLRRGFLLEYVTPS